MREETPSITRAGEPRPWDGWHDAPCASLGASIIRTRTEKGVPPCIPKSTAAVGVERASEDCCPLDDVSGASSGGAFLPAEGSLRADKEEESGAQHGPTPPGLTHCADLRTLVVH